MNGTVAERVSFAEETIEQERQDQTMNNRSFLMIWPSPPVLVIRTGPAL
ncbi:MAG: hypothetical protein RL768_2122, partial [Nitrospirota bacterium]